MFNSGKDSEDGENSGNESVSGANNGRVGRRSFLRATGAGGVAVSLAGCTFNSESTEEPNSGGGNNNGGNDDSEDTEQQMGIEGPIKLGVLAPEPTKNPIGASLANGARLAVKELNENGGIAGAEVELIVKDTHEDPAEGRRKYQELTVGEGVDATFGIFTSEVLLNVLDDIANQQTPHLTTGAATPEASKLVNEQYDKYKYHFRTGPINAHHLGVNLVDFAEAKLDELGWDSVAVLVEDYKWTEPVSAALDDQLSDTGVEIVMSERYAAGTENFGPLYDQVESSGADAAFISMAHTGTAAVVQWAKQQRPFEFGGIHVPMQLPAYYGLTKGACRYGVTQNSATPQAAVTDKTVPFANAFNEEFDGFPVYTGYITYDAVKQYAAVVEAEGSVEADAVVSGLEGSSFGGTTGTVEYYGKDSEFAHDVIYAEDKVFPVFQQWQETDGEGVQEVIFPESLTTAEYQKPPWV